MPYMLVRHNVVDYENWKPFSRSTVALAEKAVLRVFVSSATAMPLMRR
jgi:hypothetical protein